MILCRLVGLETFLMRLEREGGTIRSVSIFEVMRRLNSEGKV